MSEFRSQRTAIYKRLIAGGAKPYNAYGHVRMDEVAPIADSICAKYGFRFRPQGPLMDHTWVQSEADRIDVIVRWIDEARRFHLMPVDEAHVGALRMYAGPRMITQEEVEALLPGRLIEA